MFSRLFPSSLLFVLVVAAWLTPGQAGWSYRSKPSNLSDYYWIQGFGQHHGGDNPYTWACKGGEPLLHGRLNDQHWKLYSSFSIDDAHCLSQLVFGSTEAWSYSHDEPTMTLFSHISGAKIPLGKLHSRKLVKSKQLERVDINTVHALVRNLHNTTQEGSTPSYSQSTTDTHEVAIGFTTSVTSTAKVGVPLAGEVEIEVSLEASHTTTNSVSKTKTIEAPSQKITLAPHTEATVAFRFYKVQTRNDYMLEFAVDHEAATFNKLKEQINKKEVHAKLNREESGPALRIENGKWIVSGFPATETFWSYGTQVVLGKPMPAPDDDLLTWSAPASSVKIVDFQ